MDNGRRRRGDGPPRPRRREPRQSGDEGRFFPPTGGDDHPRRGRRRRDVARVSCPHLRARPRRGPRPCGRIRRPTHVRYRIRRAGGSGALCPRRPAVRGGGRTRSRRAGPVRRGHCAGGRDAREDAAGCRAARATRERGGGAEAGPRQCSRRSPGGRSGGHGAPRDR